MKTKNQYNVLEVQEHFAGEFSLVPIRYEDRLHILKWRNQQIHHLRQNKLLTVKDQNNYFKEVVDKLFDQDQPDQILFSYLKGDNCIGYGGIVHINWIDKNAEISFLLDTQLGKNEFSYHWEIYSKLIEKVAFKELNLHKIYTYAFDIRPNLYPVLEKIGFVLDARLKEHCFFEGSYKDVLIHSKINSKK